MIGHPGLEAPISAATPEVALPPTKPSEILSAAADLIEQPGKWTQGEYAKDGRGRGCYGFDEQAQCFCLLGAIQKVTGEEDTYELRKHVRRVVGNRAINNWNDASGRTQAEVVAALRQAAEKAREQEGQ